MKLVVAGPANSLGYGVVCVNTIHALSKLGVEVYYHPWPEDDPDPLGWESLGAYRGAIWRSVEEAHSRWNKHKPDKMPHLHIWHEWQLGGPWSGPTIGMPFFETEPVREQALPPLRSCYKVVVPSRWARGVLDRSGVKADYVQYVGVDPKVYKPEPRKRTKRFTFLHVGKYEVRKGIDVLLQAFNRFCAKDKDSQLWLLIDNPFYPKWYGEYLSRVTVAGSRIHERVWPLRPRPTMHEMANLYRSVDAVVQPSRGEGFGLPALEALACGTPVAATAVSGHSEFVEQMGGVVIPAGDLVPALDGMFFRDPMKKWFDVDPAHVHKAMVELREKKPKPKPPTEFTWMAGAKRLLDYLKGVL